MSYFAVIAITVTLTIVDLKYFGLLVRRLVNPWLLCAVSLFQFNRWMADLYIGFYVGKTTTHDADDTKTQHNDDASSSAICPPFICDQLLKLGFVVASLVCVLLINRLLGCSKYVSAIHLVLQVAVIGAEISLQRVYIFAWSLVPITLNLCTRFFFVSLPEIAIRLTAALCFWYAPSV